MQRTLRAARAATFAYFALNGFVLGMWIVHIPAVERRAGISHAVLGSLLLLLGAGAFAGMQLAGPLADRFGARRVVPVSAALCSAAVVLPGLATSGWALGAALCVLGFGNGCLDVSMNAHAVQVERGYARPVMSTFHAVFSLGGVAASLVGARTLSWGWSAAVTLGGTAAVCLAASLLAGPALLPRDADRPAEQAPADALVVSADGGGDGGGVGGGPARTGRRTPGRIWALAAICLMVMLSEGVANDWSVLATRDVLHAPAATAAFAYGSFATAMTVGRLLTDRISGRFGPVAVVRWGAGTAAVGMTAVVCSPWIPLALVGWTVFGIGLSGCVPQLFSAAGHADREAAGANVSKVAGLGYLGMLAGPAAIGALTRVVPLNAAFLLPLAFCAVAAAAAGILRGPDDTAAAGEPAVTVDAAAS
ncbi:MFS transporter [Actinacidiphila acidipaludis]|uniref:MFS transporter n=1 Tax=Actinacidiphila acidipaludis TaxID=2873382 RepID=A0ABS7Q6S5_9ACTN|nr:MFS transporter [Streptomyces acidipaludis]MBY8878832.1 MFS transporter [Streptomyces acidipaludis]